MSDHEAPNDASVARTERQTMARVWYRIVPVMALALFFGYVDKVNIGFAALTMNRDLGLTNTIFGTAAGCFAVGYALFAIPSTLLLRRVGARRWISLIMIVWGVVSAATAFVQTPGQLLTVRLLLGIAEAGFNPGAIFYLTCWFPRHYRGRVLGSFLFIMPLGLSIAGPFSGALLTWNGFLGLAGWQWLFIVQALPTVLLAVLVFFLLTDAPSEARWLSIEAREWLVSRLASEADTVDAQGSRSPVGQVFSDRRVWLLAFVNIGIGTSGIGAVIFLPLIIQSMGFSIMVTGFLAAVPPAVAALLLPLWGAWTDRSRNAEGIVLAACALIAASLLGTAALLPSPWALVTLSTAMVGFYGSIAAFWTLPSAFLTGAKAAAGIALINVAGNLGLFAGSTLLGWLFDVTQSYGLGLTCLALIATIAGAPLTMRGLRNSTRFPEAGLTRQDLRVRSR